MATNRINYTDKMLLNLENKRLDKDQLTTDITGLSVVIRTSSHMGDKNKIFYRFRHYIDGKRKVISIGTFPRMSINEARQEYLSLRTQAETGKIEKTVLRFKDLWTEFCKMKFCKLELSTVRKYEFAYSKYLYVLDEVPVEEITPDSILNILQPCFKNKNYAVAETVSILLKSCLDYAVFKQAIKFNSLTGITKYLPKNKEHKHYASFKDDTLEQDMTQLFNDIADQSFILQAMIYLYFFTLLRNAELRTVQFENYFGDYLLVKTKTLPEFKVPLCKQAKLLLDEVIARKEDKTPYIFSTNGTVVCANTLNHLLDRKGYKDKLRLHGIRSCGRQWLQTLPTAKESIIELCLSHVVGNQVQQAYNRGDYYNERVRIMQEWCDFVEKCGGDNFRKLLKRETE